MRGLGRGGVEEVLERAARHRGRLVQDRLGVVAAQLLNLRSRKLNSYSLKLYSLFVSSILRLPHLAALGEGDGGDYLLYLVNGGGAWQGLR